MIFIEDSNVTYILSVRLNLEKVCQTVHILYLHVMSILKNEQMSK